jgi:cyclopropane fatty-acyl-phospholipid synthase-like methyltransferase
MKTSVLAVTEVVPRTVAAAPDVALYYREATQDYRAWSRKLNMHFGYWRPGLSPFDSERMLDEMTLQVLARLERGGHRLRRVVDLGCGAGAPATVALRARPALRLDGVTLLEEQARLAGAAARSEGVAARAAFHAMDYTATALPSGAFDGAMAIESACHARGDGKAAFVREAARLLATGGRLVIADGFLKGPAPRAGFAAWALGQVARNWAVPAFAEIGALRRALERHGFVDIDVEEISWKLVPSVLHIPFVTIAFLARELWRSGLRLGRVRFGHVLASVLTPVVGLMRRRFGYYIVTARKA